MSTSKRNSHKLLLSKFGSNVRAVRLKQKISQEVLGFKSGLDRTYISGIERGVRNPSLLICLKISDALNVSLHNLVNFKD